jgi:hypothetical protein
MGAEYVTFVTRRLNGPWLVRLQMVERINYDRSS